jgi:hypothetical protein
VTERTERENVAGRHRAVEGHEGTTKEALS